MGQKKQEKRCKKKPKKNILSAREENLNFLKIKKITPIKYNKIAKIKIIFCKINFTKTVVPKLRLWWKEA